MMWQSSKSQAMQPFKVILLSMTGMPLSSDVLSITQPEKSIWIRKSTDDLLEKLHILNLILISLDLDLRELLKREKDLLLLHPTILARL